ncbi:MAG: PadR family transcriptional regulator [Desulfurococcaceae archaeon]
MNETKALDRLQRKLTIENLWLYIMKSLIDAKQPLSGYDIKIQLRENFGINPPAITVYTVIYRMVREGLIGKVNGNNGVKYVPREKGLYAFNKALNFLKQIYSKLAGVVEDEKID